MGNIQNLNIFNFCLEKMDNVNINRIKNYLSRYGIEENEDNFKKLKNVIEKKEYYIYEQIVELIEDCRIVVKNNSGIIIEIDSEENNTLLEDIVQNFFISKLSQRRNEKKIGHGYIHGNLFVTLKIHKSF